MLYIILFILIIQSFIFLTLFRIFKQNVSKKYEVISDLCSINDNTINSFIIYYSNLKKYHNSQILNINNQLTNIDIKINQLSTKLYNNDK